MQNPQMLEEVEKRIDPSVRNTPWLNQLYKSGMADTLYQVAGIPSGGLSTNTNPWYAAFVSPLASLHMSPDKNIYKDTKGEVSQTPETVFAHEMGHIARPVKNLPELKTSEPALWTFDKRWNNPQKYGTIKNPSPLTKAIENVDGYWRSDSEEARAQSFANAISLLRDTDKGLPQNIREVIGQREGKTPGMGIILQDILQNPIYEKHPLRKILAPSVQKP
jgi:hypothetical protein